MRALLVLLLSVPLLVQAQTGTVPASDIPPATTGAATSSDTTMPDVTDPVPVTQMPQGESATTTSPLSASSATNTVPSVSTRPETANTSAPVAQNNSAVPVAANIESTTTPQVTLPESNDVQRQSFMWWILAGALTLIPFGLIVLKMFSGQEKAEEKKEEKNKCFDLQQMLDQKIKEVTDLKGKLESKTKGVAKDKVREILADTATGALLLSLEKAEKECNRIKKLFEECMISLNTSPPMQKITPHLWFATEAKEATALYASLFPDSSVDTVNVIKDTPSGDCDLVSFTLCGKKMMAISAGPYLKLNPAISFFVTFATEEEITKVWNVLAEGGKALMPPQQYPWAKMYGWLEDKYGVSWQLSLSEHHDMKDRITPLMMFTQKVAGKTAEALAFYTGIFPNSNIDMSVPYGAGEGDTEGFIKHSRFTLSGEHFMAMDSSAAHQFTFSGAFSFIVNCDTQEEVNYYWEKLSAVPEAEQCGWIQDKYGVSWQIVPKRLDELMLDSDSEKVRKVTQAMLRMKKLVIADLEKAAE